MRPLYARRLVSLSFNGTAAPARPALAFAASSPSPNLVFTPAGARSRAYKANGRSGQHLCIAHRRWQSTSTVSSATDSRDKSAEDSPATTPAKSTPAVTSSGPAKKISVSELKRLISLAKPEQRTLTYALGLLVVSSAVSLSVPFTLGYIIDIFGEPGTDAIMSVTTAATLLTVVFLTGAAANTGRSILMRVAGQRIVNNLRKDAYRTVLTMDIGWYDLQGQGPMQDPATALTKQGLLAKAELSSAEEKAGDHAETVEATEGNIKAEEAVRMQSGTDTVAHDTEAVRENRVKGTGDIISRLGADASIVGDSITRELSEGLRSALTSVFGVGLMFYISAKLTLVMLLVVPPSAIGAVYYGRYIKKLSRRTQKAVGEMTHVAEERIGGIRTVQAFNAVDPIETKRFFARTDTIMELAKKEAYATGLYFGGTGFAGNLTLLALLSYGGNLVAQGALSVGSLSSMVLYTAYVGGSLYGLSSFYSVIMKGLGAASRIFELIDAKPLSIVLGQGRRLSPDEPPQPIRFDHVHFSYPSRPSSEILRDLTFTIQPGTSVAFAGGSGSGKTSVANLLLRFYDPAQGRVLYGDDPISAFTPESWRERIAIVPQDPALFSDTIAENIRYGNPSASMSEIREAARLANCEFIDEMPDGMETQVGVRAARLSGGQRQRLAIARALVRNPSILVLDEATSALDGTSEALVNQAVRKVTAARSLTTILIAHRLSTLRTADTIIFLEDGRVSEQGPFRELSREGSRFEMHIRSQLLGRSAPKGPPETAQ